MTRDGFAAGWLIDVLPKTPRLDRTEASVGLPSLMPDYEGVPPMPLDVDDEFITPQGYLPQPQDRPSTMTGLAMCCGLFRTFSECLFRHRAFSYTPGTAADPESTLAWIESARRDLTRQLRSFPNAWQADPQGMEDEDDRVMYGTQRANILITAASLDFALVSRQREGMCNLVERLTSSIFSPTARFESLDLTRSGYRRGTGSGCERIVYHVVCVSAKGRWCEYPVALGSDQLLTASVFQSNIWL